MKTLFSFFNFIIIPAVLFAQSTDPIIGKWGNEYGSVLIISEHSPETGLFYGTYESSTGATGKYKVSGYSPYTTELIESAPVSYTISWKDISPTGGQETPDQKWTSTMTGVLMQDNEGKKSLQVFHLLNASPPLKAVQIDTYGRYSETLIFTPKATKLSSTVTYKDFVEEGHNFYNSPLTGTWDSGTGERLEITAVSEQGSVDGFYYNSLNQAMTITGFTTTSPEGEHQSVSLSFMSPDNKYCYALGGFLNGAQGLEFMVCKAKSVKLANNYSGVRVYKINLLKRELPKPVVVNHGEIIIKMNKIPFTNNGAAEWTSKIALGSPGATGDDSLKFAVDTGGNFNWVNSVQCKDNPCVNYNHIQFDQSKSSTFNFIDPTPKPVNWGPWGQGMANLGSDILHFGTLPSENIRVNTKLITSFSDTPQFREFLWDGAIALPVDSKLTAEGVSNVLQGLVNSKAIEINAQGKVCVSFYYDNRKSTGYVVFGSTGTPPFSNVDLSSRLVFKQQPYHAVPYLWACQLKEFKVGERTITDEGSFSFDTGSSALKGDSVHMVTALDYAKAFYQRTGTWPNLSYKMGTDNYGNAGKVVLTSNEYVKLIDQGESVGTRQPQIQTLSGVPGLYLQGTTLLSSVYTVFWFNATKQNDDSYRLIGEEVWMYNYTDGPEIIQIDRKDKFINSYQESSDRVFPNPSIGGAFMIELDLPEYSDIEVYVHDSSGSLVYQKLFDHLPLGPNVLDIDIKNQGNQEKNFYYVKVFSNNKILMKRKIILR